MIPIPIDTTRATLNQDNLAVFKQKRLKSVNFDHERVLFTHIKMTFQIQIYKMILHVKIQKYEHSFSIT